jgi:hypothetical protein
MIEQTLKVTKHLKVVPFMVAVVLMVLLTGVAFAAPFF